MSSYKVRIRKSYETEFEIEADDVFEAEEKGMELFDEQIISGNEMLFEESEVENEICND